MKLELPIELKVPDNALNVIALLENNVVIAWDDIGGGKSSILSSITNLSRGCDFVLNGSLYKRIRWTIDTKEGYLVIEVKKTSNSNLI